jgi:DnaJ-class molecular chaperone
MGEGKLSEDVCLLRVSDKLLCPVCNGNGPRQVFEQCSECTGNGQQPATISTTCVRCQGSGWYDKDRKMRCFGCSGRGRRYPLCRGCTGSGQRLIQTLSCDGCDDTGRSPVARVIASHARTEYVHRMADVMAACADEDDLIFRDRGQHLYNVLREVYKFAQQDCPNRIQELFPDPLVGLIRQSWASLCSKAAG